MTQSGEPQREQPVVAVPAVGSARCSGLVGRVRSLPRRRPKTFFTLMLFATLLLGIWVCRGQILTLILERNNSKLVSLAEATHDLDELTRRLEETYSYLKLRGVDYQAEIERIRARLDTGISRGALAIELQKLLALFGDGHTRVDNLHRYLPAGYLPFSVAATGERVVAFMSDRSGFIADGYPYLRRLDGVDVGDWLKAAEKIVPRGSPQFVRTQAVSNLRAVVFLRNH